MPPLYNLTYALINVIIFALFVVLAFTTATPLTAIIAFPILVIVFTMIRQYVKQYRREVQMLRRIPIITKYTSAAKSMLLGVLIFAIIVPPPNSAVSLLILCIAGLVFVQGLIESHDIYTQKRDHVEEFPA